MLDIVSSATQQKVTITFSIAKVDKFGKLSLELSKIQPDIID